MDPQTSLFKLIKKYFKNKLWNEFTIKKIMHFDLNNNEIKHLDIQKCFPIFLLLTIKVICQILQDFINKFSFLQSCIFLVNSLCICIKKKSSAKVLHGRIQSLS